MANYSEFKKISTESIIDNSITTADIADVAVLSDNIQANSVTADKIVNNAVSDAKLSDTIDLSAKTVVYRPFTNTDFSNAAGISTSRISGLGTLAELNSVSSSQIAAGAITSGKLASGAQQSGYTFMGRMQNNSEITGGTSSWVRFDSYQNGNSDIFEVVTTGEYGVRVKKAGHVQWMYTQDIITSGSTSYFTIRSYINSVHYGYQLMRNTGGAWDCIFITGAAQVAANDVVKINYNAAPQSLDNGEWSQFALLWVGYE
jgi:hypothetical protein